jgi:predicted amidohydrolase
MREIILCDLSINVNAPDFYRQPLENKFNTLAQALRMLEQEIVAARNIPPHQKLQGILISHEDYFRCANRKNSFRPYSETQMREIERAICQLSRQHPRILIIPGTISWRKKVIDPRYHFSRKASYADYLVSKEARGISSLKSQASWKSRPPSQSHGGQFPTLGPTKAYAYQKIYDTWGKRGAYVEEHLDAEKEYKKDLDDIKFNDQLQDLSVIRNTAIFYLEGQQKYKYHKSSQSEADEELNEPDAPSFYLPGTTAPILNIAGINIGIEICIDHYYGLLDEYLQSEQKAYPFVDLHLILSNVVPNKPENSLLRQKGYLIHSSFLQEDEHLQVTSQCYQQEDRGRKNLSASHRCLGCQKIRENMVLPGLPRAKLLKKNALVCEFCQTPILVNFLTLNLEVRYPNFKDALQGYRNGDFKINELFKVSNDHYQNFYYLSPIPAVHHKGEFFIPGTGSLYLKQQHRVLNESSVRETLEIENAHDRWGWTNAHQAAAYGPRYTLPLVIEKPKRSLALVDKWKRTPLHWAALNGDKRLVEAFLGKQRDINAIDIGGRTALHWAATNGHTEIVKLLLDKKADMDVIDNDLHTALELALQKEHLDVIKLLRLKEAQMKAPPNKSPPISHSPDLPPPQTAHAPDHSSAKRVCVRSDTFTAPPGSYDFH